MIQEDLNKFKDEFKSLNIQELEAYRSMLWTKYQEVKTIIQFKKELEEVSKNGR